MNKPFYPSLKTEKFAAYLDGNMPADELREMADLIRQDSALQEIVDICDEVDADMETFAANGDRLPDNIGDPHLQIPDPDIRNFSDRFNRHYGMAMMERMAEDLPAPAMCACDCNPKEEEEDSPLSQLKDKLHDWFSNKKKNK